MKIRTINSKNKEQFDAEVNTFGESHNVKFTQTHINTYSTEAGTGLYYSAVLFYED